MAYNLLFPVTIFNAVSMATSQTSSIVCTAAPFTVAALKTSYQDNFGIQLDWTGTPVGTFSVQISSNRKQDDNGNVLFAGNWITLPLSPAIVASGTADDAYIDLNQMSCQFIQVIYTAVSGSGTLNGVMVGKAV